MKTCTRNISTGKVLSLFLILIAIALAATTVACSKRDGSEKAGEKVDDAIEGAKDAVDHDGPVENAGEKLDDKLDGK